MKTSVPHRLRTWAAALALACLGFAAQTASAATLTFSTTAPTPGSADVYNFTGSATDGANVSDNGVTRPDGDQNDAFTYVAPDRRNQGQTFTTGPNTNGYLVASVWLRHAGYTSNTNATWYRMPNGSVFRIRMTRPSQAGTAGFVLDNETYTITGSEPNKLPAATTNTPNGTGVWFKFTFDTPVTLSPNTVYGFDLTTASADSFFELAGTSADSVGGGSAYQGATAGNAGGPDNTRNALTGDRVFLVELAPVGETTTFVTQPASFTGFVGDSLTLSAAATGNPIPTYQWEKSTNGGTTWVPIPDATAEAYSIPVLAYGHNGLYRLVATNTSGSVPSNVATVTVSYPAPTVTKRPYNATVVAGSDVSLTVVATGIGTLTYQWLLNDAPIGGATAATLPRPGIAAAAAGTYSVVISDPAATADGQPATTTTVTFTLDVIDEADATVAYYRFEDGEDGATIATATDSSGGNNTMTAVGAPSYSATVPAATVSATGASNTRAANFPTGDNALVSATTGSIADTVMTDFTIEAYVRYNELGGFQNIIGRDDAGTPGEGTGQQSLLYFQKSNVNRFRVEVITATNTNVQANSLFEPVVNTWYHVAAVGNSLDGSLKFYVDGIEVAANPANTPFTGMFIPSSGSNTPWTIGRGSYNDAAGDWFRGLIDEARISRVALNPVRFLNGNPTGVPNPTITQAVANRTVRVGSDVTLSVAATGVGALTYQWFKDGSPIGGATSATLQLTNVQATADGVYSVAITDTAGGTPPSISYSEGLLHVVDAPLPNRALSLNLVGTSSGQFGYSALIGTLAPTDSAGFLPVANWNNSSTENRVGTSLTPLALAENTGAVGAATATWASAESWAALDSNGDPADKTPNLRVLHGYIESRAATGSTVTVSGIPYASYDVYVYFAGGNPGNVGRATTSAEGGATYYYKLVSHDAYDTTAFNTLPYSYMLSDETTIEAARAAPAAHFVRFAGLADSDLTVTLADAVAGANAGGIAAVQIVDRTPPGTPYPPTITTSPVSQLKAGGSSATFTVSAVSNNPGGVISYQWEKNGSPIGGQTSSTLVRSNLTGDDSGAYSVVVKDTAPGLGEATVTRTASLVVVDGTRSLLINGDINAGAGLTQTGNGMLSADGTATPIANLGLGDTVWNGIVGGTGSATRVLAKESTGLSLPDITFSYSGAEGAEDNTTLGDIATSAALQLSRDYLFTNNQTTPITATIGGLQAFAGHQVTLLAYAYGKNSKALLEAADNDTATLTLDPANNHLGLGSAATTTLESNTPDAPGRRLEYNNLEYTGGQSAAYVTFTGVVAANGTVSWTVGADSDGGLIPLVGFQLLVTAENLAPPAPTNLVATPGDAQVSLTWNASAGASTYTILRSDTAGGPYTSISTGAVTGTNYTDNNAANGATYYYVVSAVATNPVLASAYSNEATATLSSSASALETWRETYFGSPDNTGDGADTADYDGDGIPNLLEYALGTDPTAANTSPVVAGRDGDFLTLAFDHIGDATLVYSIEASNDLTGAWTTVHTYPAFTTAGTQTHTDTVALGAATRRFLRLRVTAAE